MTPATLEVKQLAKTYFSTDPPTEVLTGIDLSVRPGEFVSIMGASGSGKSTLLYNISGMDRPTSGTVVLNGNELTSLSDAQMSHVRLTQMGFVFQQAYFLTNLSVRDNILLPALKGASKESRETVVSRVDELIGRFGIAQIANHAITQASGGQLQRASICRALAGEPSVIFADEPTGALNSSMSLEVMNYLTDVHRSGTTILMVTHDPAVASRGDRIVYLRDGAIADSYVAGPWQQNIAQQREDALVAWLRRLGF